MSQPLFFQNREYIVPYNQVTHIIKYPPDRLQIGVACGSTVDILGVEDCGLFIKGYAAYLNQAAPAGAPA